MFCKDNPSGFSLSFSFAVNAGAPSAGPCGWEGGRRQTWGYKTPSPTQAVSTLANHPKEVALLPDLFGKSFVLSRYAWGLAVGWLDGVETSGSESTWMLT